MHVNEILELPWFYDSSVFFHLFKKDFGKGLKLENIFEISMIYFLSRRNYRLLQFCDLLQHALPLCTSGKWDNYSS